MRCGELPRPTVDNLPVVEALELAMVMLAEEVIRCVGIFVEMVNNQPVTVHWVVIYVVMLVLVAPVMMLDSAHV